MPSMKQHPCWCRFVFGVFSLPYHRCRIRNDTLVGVVSSSASFPQPYHPPSTKQHPCWCCFMLRSFPIPRINFKGVYYIFSILLFNFIYILIILYSACGNLAGIPHPSLRDRNSAGTGAGQPKMPHGTPVSITRPITPKQMEQQNDSTKKSKRIRPSTVHLTQKTGLTLSL